MEDKEKVADSPEENITIIEKNIHRTNLRRLIDTLYLFVPIALAFAGCFLAAPCGDVGQFADARISDLDRVFYHTFHSSPLCC